MDQTDTIYFYDRPDNLVKAEHVCLNNFAESPFIADDNFTYSDVEHYYQAHKFDNFDQHPELKPAYEEIR
jgi:predicted NAD-dependent protein-ADP-ribosyltransferase YbiA (DUF1768 family)